MSTDTPQSPKPRFYDICYNLDYQTLLDIANKVEVTKSVMDAMLMSIAIHRSDANKILVAFSQHTGTTWTLDNVRVALLPTFKDLHAKHAFDLESLTTEAGVPFAIIDMMLDDAPVPKQEARLVLRVVSKEAGEDYTFENVDVQLEKEDTNGK